MEINWTRDQLRDTTGRPLTQSLFLEFGYRTEFAIFTLNDEDKLYKDKTYWSLKRFYLEIGDPTEYEFANECLLGWTHWKRLLENKLIRKELDIWRDELEIALRSEGIRNIMNLGASDGGNFQAAKWLADKGWDKRTPGRPSKEAREREREIDKRINDELEGTVIRMEKFGG